MIILKKETDIKKLKRWDPWTSQEYLDLIASMNDFIDVDKIKSISDKWNILVDTHIAEVDAKNTKEYELNRQDNKKK